MPRADMSSAAVTARLVRTAQLRRLCLALRPPPRPRTQGGMAEPPRAR
jgi:hypothetical protein